MKTQHDLAELTEGEVKHEAMGMDGRLYSKPSRGVGMTSGCQE